MSTSNDSYDHDAETFVSATSTEHTNGTDGFEQSHESDGSSQTKTYGTDTFVTGTARITEDSQEYSDTFESTFSDNKQSLLDSQSTITKSPRKTSARHSYSADSLERSSPTDSRYTTIESYSERLSYSDTFEDSKTEEETGTSYSYTQTVSEDSEAEEEARAAEAKFLVEKYEHMLYGEVQDEKQVHMSTQKTKSKGEKQLNKYCQKKLEIMKNKAKGGVENFDEQNLSADEHDQTPVKNYGVSEGMVSRLKLHNLIDRMKQVASAEVHSPKHCGECRHQIEHHKQEEYLKHKTAIARRKMVDEQFDTLCAKDSLAIFGEMIGSLPKLSDDPDEVWERLMKPLQEREGNKQQLVHPM